MFVRKPLNLTAERFAAAAERDPTAEFGWRHRWRPLSMFNGNESAHQSWNAKYAGKSIGGRNGKQVFFKLDNVSYDLARVEEELGAAVDAIHASSPGEPRDGDSGGIAGDSGKLMSVLKAASRRSGLHFDDLTVLATVRDPYRIDTPKGHREAKWFTDWLDQKFPDDSKPVHLRGLHYALISTGGVMKPNGRAYENTDKDFEWLVSEAAKAARWLGYVGFDRFKDQRNDEPVECRRAAELAPAPEAAVQAVAFEGNNWQLHLTGEIDITPPAVAEFAVGGEVSLSDYACEPYVYLSGVDASEQPYAFAFFGEKSSLEPVLGPIAREYGANMYLCSGEISDTLIFHMAQDADADGRPLVCFTFSDFDPAGHQMPISIGRKALRDFQFPSLRAEVVPVSLTLEQVLAERLPTTPVKSKEKRGKKWNEAFGPAMREAGLVTGSRPAQVEIDALAVINPDVLRRITIEAIALYRDETVDERAAAVRSQWQELARPIVEAQTAEHRERLDEIKQAAEEAVEEFNTARAALIEAIDEAKDIFLESFEEARQAFVDAVEGPKEALDDAHDKLVEIDDDLDEVTAKFTIPELPQQVETEIDLTKQSPIVRLDWSFEDATAALKSHKAYEGGDEIDDEEDEDGEDDEDDA